MSKQKSEKDKDKDKSKGKNGKKNTSLRLDSKTLKALKIRAIEEDSSVQGVIESLVHLYLNHEVQIAKDKEKE